MGQNSMQKLNEIAHLFSQIQNHVNALPMDAMGIVQLFFDSQLSISEIAHIYESSPDRTKGIINDFLVELIAKSHGLQQFLSCFYLEDKNVVTDLRIGANSLIETCDTTDSTGARIREMIGTAIRIGIPPFSPNLLAETISKVDAANRIRKNYPAKFSVKLSEPDFFLGKQRIAAGVETPPTAKMCSGGSVVVGRGLERVEVSFHIKVENGTTGEYVITFHNLPNWAVPISFSFAGPDKLGMIKEYTLPIAFGEGKLYIKIENEEQEIAFLDCTEVYIGFIVSESSR